MKAYYQIFVHDRHGRLKYLSRQHQCRSYVKNFLVRLQGVKIGVSFTVIDTTNTGRSKTGMGRWDGGVGILTKGIIVGTGTTAPTNTDYVMESPIAHGTGAGELQYQATTYTWADVVGANVDAIITRTFLNGSGGTVTVNEIGIYCLDTQSYLELRDVLAAGVDVENGETLTVQYTLRTTV